MSDARWEPGMDAARRRDWVAARELLEGVLDAGSGASAEQLAALGDAAWWLSDIDVAIAARERAFKLTRDAGTQEEAALLALTLAQDHGAKMQGAIAGAWVTRARGLVADRPESIAAGYLERLLARNTLDLQGRSDAALTHIDEALRIAVLHQDRNLEMLATHDRGQILVTMGRGEEGMPLMEEAMLAAASGELSPDTVGKVYCNMIAACIDTAEYGAAAQWSDQAERWCEAASTDSGYPGVCRVRRSEINRRRGLLSAAEEGARRAAAELVHFVPFAAAAHAEIGYVHLQRGELELAEAEFSTAHELGNTAMPGLAQLRRAQGESAVAVELIRTALDAAAEMSLARARLVPTAVELLLESGESDEASALVGQMEAIADRFGSAALRASAEYVRGLVAAAEGASGKASVALREAFTSLRDCGLPYEAARARFALGRVLVGSGAVAAGELEIRAAATEFGRLEAHLDKAEVGAFLAVGEPVIDVGAEARTLLARLSVAVMSGYLVVGAYARFDDVVRNRLADARQRISAGLVRASGNRDNHLVWAAPGSGKTFFVEQIAENLRDVRYVELNLARLDEAAFTAGLADAVATGGACLVLVDEVDAKPDTSWPYEVLLPFLDVNVDRGGQVVFVMAGSSGSSMEDMKRAIASRPKGKDLLSRTPAANELVVAPLGTGDQFLVALSQLQRAAARAGFTIRAVEKAALYYVAITPYLANARQLSEFMARSVGRMGPGEDRLKYDHLFSPGDAENKEFWAVLTRDAPELIGSFVTVQ